MTDHDRQQLVDQLVLHEGLKLKPYMDTVGKITIGVGRNISDVGISQDEAMAMLDRDIDECLADLASFAWFADLDTMRRRVLVDMRFNLGPSRFRGFKRMLAAMAEGDYQKASVSMRESLWYRQVKTRGERLVKMMQSGADDA